MRLSTSFSEALRTFSFWIANGTVGMPVLEGVDYVSVLLKEPSALEQTYAIFANVIEMDDNGKVINAKYAEKRAVQWLRSFIDPTFEVTPPLEDWEIDLHEPGNQKIS